MSMILDDYVRKRNFEKTSEPSGITEPSAADKNGERLFVIHKHQASHLHYDLRLESGGVLKSWAVPKGPSLNPGDKRLAVEVEDHPMSYADFEGVIPEGEYGAGGVIIWDRGHFRLCPENESFEEMLNRGSLKIEIFGSKLRGRFVLVRTRWGGKKANWLLIKEKDDYARDSGDILAEEPRSVVSGREVNELE